MGNKSIELLEILLSKKNMEELITQVTRNLLDYNLSLEDWEVVMNEYAKTIILLSLNSIKPKNADIVLSKNRKIDIKVETINQEYIDIINNIKEQFIL